MRAKFVIKIGATSVKAFPTDEDLVERLSMLGLHQVAAIDEPYEVRRKEFQEKAEKEWEALPEVAADEKDRVIFFARLPDHGRIIVTRLLAGLATVRLIHDDLARLERTAEWLSGELGKKVGAIVGFEIEESRIEIYERGKDNVILVGRVVRSALRETARRHPGDWISALVTGVAAVVSLLILTYAHPNDSSVFGGTVSRFSTAMIAAFFIAAVTFVQHFGAIKRHGEIEWRPAHRHGSAK